jgi:hypothetical protein
VAAHPPKAEADTGFGGTVITAVTGKPGAGKSFRLVCGICEHLSAGGYVASNVPLIEDWYERLAKRSLLRRAVPGAVAKREADLKTRFFYSEDVNELLRVKTAGKKEGRGLWVLDEAHEHLNSRTWGAEERLVYIKWLSRSRHRGWNVELGTQHFDSLDKQLRDRIEFEEVIRNLRRAQIMGLPIVPFNLFMSIKVWIGGPTQGQKKHVAKRRFYLLDDRRKLYDTHGLRDLADDELAGEQAIWLPLPSAELHSNGVPRQEGFRGEAGGSEAAGSESSSPRAPGAGARGNTELDHGRSEAQGGRSRSAESVSDRAA